MGATHAGNVGDTPATPPAGDPAAVTPPADAPAPGEGGTGLPSDNPSDQATPWERAKQDGFLPDDFKEDPYELAKSWKNAQEFVKEANAEKGRNTNAANAAAAAEATGAEILSMVPEFMRNGMELTAEMETKAKKLNIDIRDLKLGAIELRDNMTKAYGLVGGEATYAEMMTDMSPHMSDAQKKAFNTDLGGEASEYAIKGLHAEWQASKIDPNAAPGTKRIEGRVNNQSSVKPYGSQAEMLKDAGYLRSPSGKTDKAARAQYEARKAVTPDSVVFRR